MGKPWFMYDVTRGFTGYTQHDHDGWDFGAPSRTPLISLTGGKVTRHTGWYPWGGEIDIKGGILGSNITETFAHADDINVHAGDTVYPGQQVGLSGGENLPRQYSTGPHVHYSLFGGAPWDNKYAVDPGKFLTGIRQNGVGSMLGSADGGDVGVQIATAIGDAYGRAEYQLGKTVKRAGYFILGLTLIMLGIGLLILAGARASERAIIKSPEVQTAAKLVP